MKSLAGLMAVAWVLLAGACLGQGAAVSEAKRPMTFKDLMAMKRVSDPQISSSGKWVLFSVTEVSLEKNTKINNLWVVAIGGGEERQLTFGEVNQTFGRFSPDGKWVSLISPGGGTSQIWTAAWDEATGTMKKPYPLTDISTEADGAVWSPDSKRLLFVSSVSPECSVKGGVLDKGSVAGLTVGNPTHRDGAAMNGAPGEQRQNTGVLTGTEQRAGPLDGKNVEVLTGTEQRAGPLHKRNAAVSPLRRQTAPPSVEMTDSSNGMEAASWAEEAACNKAKDEAAAKSAVKAQVWDGLLYRHWNAFTGKKRSHVLAVSRANGEDIRDLTPASVVGDAETPTFSLGGPLGYAWAPGSEEIAFVANLDKVPAASTNNDVFTLLLDDKGAKPRKISTSLGSDDGPAYSPDGKYIAFRSQLRAGYESDRFRLMLFDRLKATNSELELTMKDYSAPGRPKEKDLDRWVDEFIWSDDSQRIFFAAADHGEEVIYGTNVTGDDLHRFGKTSGEWGSLVQVPTEYKLVSTLMQVNRPAEIALADLTKMDDTTKVIAVAVGKASRDVTPKTAPPNYLTHQNEVVLEGISSAVLESYLFTGAEGTQVQGFVVRPPNFDPAKKYPLKFLIHGGPQGAWGDAWSYRWNAELMAADGYVVVMVNPRGSTGYGQAFIDGVNGDWGGKAYVDLMKGLDAAEAKFPFIDKERECALGASYGGFMANWVLTHTNRFKCIVTHDGMYNPAAAYGDTEEMWFNEWEFRRAEDLPRKTGGQATTEAGPPPTSKDDTSRGVGQPAQPWRYAALPVEQDPFRKWSPMLHIQDAKTPTLVIHSQKDYRLDVSEGFQLFTALQRLGVPSRMLYFPDEGHWVLKPQNSQLWYDTVGDWCDRWTKSGRYAVK